MIELHGATLPALAARARALAAGRPRVLIGIAGAPGAGKSTLAALLVEQLGGDAVVVAMDGFHLTQAELERLGREDRKGAPDTFDAAAFVALLRELREPGPARVHAPRFSRELEEPIAGAVEVSPDVRFVVVEGNYLLLDEAGWRDVQPLLDETWFLHLDPSQRQRRLVARRVALGAGDEEARRWTFGSDEHNAVIVDGTRARADLVVHLVDSVDSIE